jgi:hypothetical protein
MSRYRGKHRKPSSTSRTVARFAVAGAVVTTPIGLASTASASPVNWDALAQCESSGNWSANTGNGFSGGLQFTQSTWNAYGGSQYAPSAASASRDQQITVAQRVLAAQGPGAWPVCSTKTSFLSGSGSSSGDVTVSTAVPERRSEQSSAPAASAGEYTVRSGDTLSKIGRHLGVDWRQIFEHNGSTLHNPNMIFPGEHLAIP